MLGQIAPDAVEFVLQMLLKAADLTHTTAATDQHLFWTACLEEEMYRQVQSPALSMHCSCRSLYAQTTSGSTTRYVNLEGDVLRRAW